MHLTNKLFGAHFGNLAKIHGIIYYKISSFEQRAFAGAINDGIPNTLRRIGENVLIVVPPFIIGTIVYNVTEWKHNKLGRKDPKEFENDE